MCIQSFQRFQSMFWWPDFPPRIIIFLLLSFKKNKKYQGQKCVKQAQITFKIYLKRKKIPEGCVILGTPDCLKY